jgi:predicted porin
MKGLGAAAATAAVIMSGVAGGAGAADLNALPVKAPPPAAGPETCTSIQDFFTTACRAQAYGVRFYGSVDIGYGYDTNGSNFGKYLTAGISYNPGKFNTGARWELSPNAVNQSNVGILVKEPLGGGWSFVGQLEMPFSPVSGLIPSGGQTQHENLNVPLALQTANNDTNHDGKFYSSEGYLGFSNDTWGTLTFLRQGSLFRDINTAYDPIAGSNAFSLITASGTYSGGGGSEQVRETTSVKYRVLYGNYRLGLFGQAGGYDLGNSSRGTFQGGLGADFFNVGPGILTVDAGGSYTRDAVSLSLTGAAVNPLTGLGIPTSAPTAIQASISNNTEVLATAKYIVDKFRVSGGYYWVQYAPPSDVPASFTDISGFAIGGVPNTAITGSTYAAKDKILQLVWGGVRYSITDSLDVDAAWYHSWQNDYSNGAATAGSRGKTTCAVVTTALSSCAGSQDTISAVLDWKFGPKWDVYIGTGFVQLNGGQDSGYLSRGNWNTTAGIRFTW